ncbi:MAG: hypothetical protein JRI75_02275 [Deltaproteobacteria bacterium]|nr:hypothetical protein [Deltaproteobacteria bacterium]
MTPSNTGTSKDNYAAVKQILDGLNRSKHHDHIFSEGVNHSSVISSVLFLLGTQTGQDGVSSGLSLILNKRSLKVKQPGDLCCPGGSISSRLDTFLARLLHLPGSPLTRWPYWDRWRMLHHRDTKNLALLFATGLRESLEEMRLNPLGVKFLGPLPPQRLVMFNKVIYPMVCRVSRQKRFFPNWEVEKVIFIPIKNFLNPDNYACYRVRVEVPTGGKIKQDLMDYPSFIHRHKGESEILWGATFRIAMVFLDFVYGFKPPDIDSVPVIHGTLGENYLTGNA